MRIVLIMIFYNTIAVDGGFLQSIYNVISITERCDDKWVTRNVSGLEEDLQKYVYGQPFVSKVLVPLINIHLADGYEPKKPLTLSFHGWPGTGKNYVADFIIKHIFRKGNGSKFKKLYSGRLDFPIDAEVDKYKLKLQQEIKDLVQLCHRSVFVFDELDKMPEGIIDAIKPFLDYNNEIDGVDYRKAIFIFLSNIGQQVIIKKCQELRNKGLQRIEYPHLNFDKMLVEWAFNNQGGLKETSVVKNFLIDAYIPFLPLEREHVLKCIRDESDHLGIHPTEDLLEYVIEQLAFGPEPDRLYSITGCKNLKSKILLYSTEKHYIDEL